MGFTKQTMRVLVYKTPIFFCFFSENKFMEKLLAIQLHNRKIFHYYLDQFNLDQLNRIPKGFNNNILWNIAHTVVTQQLLVYKISGLDMHIPKEWVGLFSKGTKPERTYTAEEVIAIDAALFSTHDALEKDISAGVFKEYTPYTTSTGMVLDSVETTLNFILFHDGIHLGSILALAKLV